MTAITEFVDLDRHGRVAVLTVNHPPVNALNHGVRQGLKEWVVAALGDAAISAIVITCAGQTFIAGSDIAEFTKPPQAPGLKALRDRMLEYQEQLGGDHWQPAALLNQLADQGKTFTGYRSTLSYEGLYGRRTLP